MRSVVSSQWSVVRKGVFLLFTFYFLLGTSCVTGSMPNLEQPDCTDSRLTVKQFYSFHLGNEMKFSQENLKLREKFLTPEFYKSLQSLQTENDVFTTNSTDIPRAFKLGGCTVIEPTKTEVEVLLFWKDSARIEQKSIFTEVVKQGDTWLINKVLYSK
ncbi:MAG: hypothetical protein K1X72_01530 [Pyrinomonadaceae bacterium]|nr:hypothetical protein [Pyrinomonadaceae bacterium]